MYSTAVWQPACQVTWHLCELTGAETVCDSSNQHSSFPSRTALPMWGRPSRLDSGMIKLITSNPKISSGTGSAGQERRGPGMGKGYESLCMTVECGNTSPWFANIHRIHSKKNELLCTLLAASWSWRIRTSLPAIHTRQKTQTLIAEQQGGRGMGRGGETGLSGSFCTSTVCWD